VPGDPAAKQVIWLPQVLKAGNRET